MMLLKENAVYKHACVKCYQLCTIPRNSLIPKTQTLLTHFKKLETLREKKKIKQPDPFAEEFHIISSFWALKISSDGDHNLPCWSSLVGKMLLLTPICTPISAQCPTLPHVPTGATRLILVRELCAGTGRSLLGSPEATSPSPPLNKPQSASA